MDVALNRSFDSPFPDSATVITIINHDLYIYIHIYGCISLNFWHDFVTANIEIPRIPSLPLHD